MMESQDLTTIIKKKKKASGDQFKKLLKTISELEKMVTQQKVELNDNLNFYHKEIEPIVNERKELVDEWIQLLMTFYSSTQLKEKDKALFSEIIANQLMEYTYLSNGQMPEHLDVIFKIIEGKSFEEAKNEEINDSLESIQERFSEMGVDLDMSGINANDSEEEIVRKMAEMLNKEFEKRGSDEPKSSKKNKRLDEKERKEKIAEVLKKKNLNSVYRELAKAIHPDLEQNSELKKIKEEVMKELTDAYEKQDLRTLFRLEMEWLKKEESEINDKPDELLKVYIKLLKDQIEDLKIELEMEEMNPRYARLKHFFDPDFPLAAINQTDWMEREKTILDNYRENVKSIKNYRPPVLPKMLRELISEFRKMRSAEAFW